MGARRLRACIHRGASEIGGNCVELESGGSRLVLDLGRPLWAEPGEHVPLPPIRGLEAGGDASLIGVVLSHGHLDHYGLLDQVAPTVPLYAGAASARILREAAFFSPAGLDRRWAGSLADRQPLRFGPFTLTPYLIDHSAFDAYALLVEANGRRLFYSGDVRAHGLQGDTFDRLVSDPPRDVDVLLLEGTRVGIGDRDGRSSVSEAELTDEFLEVFAETRGLVLVAYSAQNVDRLLTLHAATKRSASMSRPRQLVIDPYVDAIASATGSADVPRSGDRGVKTYVPQSQRVRIKRSGEFDRVNRIRGSRIFPEDLRKRRQGLVLTCRPSMAGELERADCLADAHLVWSMWPGYVREERMTSFREFLSRNDIGMSTIHASGHARVSDLQRLAAAVKARRVIPIHTSAPEQFPATFDLVRLHSDGEWWTV